MAARLALFIGNSSYDDPTLTRLKTPAADVAALAATFRDPAIGDFDEVRELIDETESTVRRAIAEFFARRHPEDLLLLYFSGHGVKDDRGRLYLAVRDTLCGHLSATGIASAYVTEHMDECRSKRQILILDCCNSGAFARGTKGGTTAMTAETFAGNGYGRVVLTASDATQYALEGDQVIERADLSLFTHYLLDGLTNGVADEDVITLDALYDHVYGKIVSTTPGQTPKKWVYNQQGALIIARNPRRKGGLPLVIDPELRSRIADPRAQVRLGAVADLGRLLDSGEKQKVAAAREGLGRLADADRSKVVRAAAREALERRMSSSSPASRPLSSPHGEVETAEPVSREPSKVEQPTVGPHPLGALLGSKTLGDAIRKTPSSEEIMAAVERVSPLSWLSTLPPRGAWIVAITGAFAIAGLINGGLLRGSMLVPYAYQPTTPLLTGAIEGALLAVGMFLIFRIRGVQVDPKLWFAAMIVADVIRWQIPIFGWPNPSLLGIVAKGILDGLLIGAAQAWALRLAGATRVMWIGANAVGWTVAVYLFGKVIFSFNPATLVNNPAGPSILLGVLSGVAVGAVTSLVLPVVARAPANRPGTVVEPVR